MKTLSTKDINEAIALLEEKFHCTLPKAYTEDLISISEGANICPSIVIGERTYTVKSFMKPIEDEIESVYTALCAVEPQNLLPFAYEETGLMFCFDTKCGKIVLYNRKTKEVIIVTESYEKFRQL